MQDRRVNLGKAAFLAVEKPKGYPFSEVVKKGTDDFRCSLGKYISQYGMFWHTLQQNLDSLIPGLAALLLTLLCCKLLKKKVSPITIIIALFVVGIIGRVIGIM